MSARERTDLARLARERGRVAEAAAEVRGAELMADFEQQLASIYSWDDDATWKAAAEAATEVEAEANRIINERCEALGIPKKFRPSLGLHWYGRGENATASRRVELRKVAQSRVAAMTKDAKQVVKVGTLEVTTALLEDGLTTEAARAWLARMPDVAALMPRLDAFQLPGITVAGGWGTKRTIAPLSRDEVVEPAP